MSMWVTDEIGDRKERGGSTLKTKPGHIAYTLSTIIYTLLKRKKKCCELYLE